jgi:hypothetical protein
LRDVIYEHWLEEADDGLTSTLLPEDSPNKRLLAESARLCCTIEAATHEEAMQKYHAHMGWDPYKPMDPSP